jgi:type II secretory pathway component PulJ
MAEKQIGKCTCGHSWGVHEAGHRSRCVYHEGCGCTGYREWTREDALEERLQAIERRLAEAEAPPSGEGRGVMNVEAVNLRREGGENDPLARAVVSVKINGEWREVISELSGNNFDHYVNLDLLFKASPPSDWWRRHVLYR